MKHQATVADVLDYVQQMVDDHRGWRQNLPVDKTIRVELPLGGALAPMNAGQLSDVCDMLS